MIKESGFVLLVVSIILWVSGLLLMGTWEAFVLERQLAEAHYEKIQNFYAAESKILEIRRSIEQGESPSSAQFIKTDRCQNRYYRIHLKNPSIEVEYRFFNPAPSPGCPKNQGIAERLWWSS